MIVPVSEKWLSDFSMIYPLRKSIEIGLLPVGLCVLFVLICNHAPNAGTASPGQSPVANETPKQIPTDLALRRRPVACCLNKNESVLLVASGRSGTISAIQVDDGNLLGEWQVGECLTDLVRWRDDLFLAVDATAGQLICLDFAEPVRPVIPWRCQTIAAPNRLLVDPSTNRCFVGGLWSRQLCVVNLPDDMQSDIGVKVSTDDVVDLPFSAGAMCRIDGESPALLLLDAFSSRWSTYDLGTLKMIASGRNKSRRASGVAIHPKSGNICMTEQTLNHLAHAIRNDVHWGTMIGNNIRTYSASQFVQQSVPRSGPSADAFGSWHLTGDSVPLGGASDAKADPESIAFANNGTAIIALGGVDQVAVGALDDHSFKYYATGRRPVAMAVTDNNKLLFVCNNLDDSITVINLRDREIEATLSLGKQPDATQQDQGERLFFDGRVSHDAWMSCHSCHVNGHSNGFLNDNLADQSFGAPKRVLSLLGHADTGPFAWNGSFESMHEQIKSSIVNTMQADEPPTVATLDALAAFVNSLPSPTGLAQSRNALSSELSGELANDAIETGRKLFLDLDCATCHSPEQNWTTGEQYDVGLTDELGNTQFNPPSLIGVGQQAAYLHDARYSELQDVFLQGKHRLERELSNDELQSLMMFLNSL